MGGVTCPADFEARGMVRQLERKVDRLEQALRLLLEKAEPQPGYWDDVRALLEEP